MMEAECERKHSGQPFMLEPQPPSNGICRPNVKIWPEDVQILPHFSAFPAISWGVLNDICDNQTCGLL